MNPMTNVKNIKKLSEQDIRLGGKSSWHDQYKDSAWIFVGGLPYDLTEGDIICAFSQYGEVVNINLVRDKETGKQRGFCFLCYEDQRSTILAVDNFNGIKILGRTLRVDHVENYKAPQEGKNPVDEKTKLLREEGCAPMSTIAQSHTGLSQAPVSVPQPPEDIIVGGIRLPPRLPIEIKSEKDCVIVKSSKKKKEKHVKVKKEKKSKKEKKKKEKRKRKYSTSESSSSSSSSSSHSESSEDERDKRKHKNRRKH